MKKMKIVVTALAFMATNQSFASPRSLEPLVSHEGGYTLATPSDYYCQKLTALRLKVNGTEVTLQLEAKRSDGKVVSFEETLHGVNTNSYTEVHYINAVVGYYRNVFRDSSLKKQEALWFMHLIPGSYKDKRTVLTIIDAQTIVYNYAAFGSTSCTFVRSE